MPTSSNRLRAAAPPWHSRYRLYVFYESERYEVRIVGQVLIDLESGGIFKSPIESRFDEAVPVPPPMNGWCTELGPRSAQVFLFDRPLGLCSVNNYPERPLRAVARTRLTTRSGDLAARKRTDDCRLMTDD